MVKNEYLPIGTIVTLKDADSSKYMITEYFPLHTKKLRKGYFDYGAILYPNGREELTIHFNNEDIKEILFKGYDSEKLNDFQNELNMKEKEIPWGKFSNTKKKSIFAELLSNLKK